MTAMTPMAFTDVLCACSNVPDNLVGIHWYKNKLQNNSNVRANSNWYYVVGTHGTGEPREWATYEKALKYVATDRVEEDYDGSLLAIWNDYNNPFTAEEVANVKTLIRTQATSSGLYQYVGADISADGKTLTLHYNINSEKAAVEQALPEGYTVADVTFSDVTVTCGEASDVAFTAAETPAPVGLLQKIVQIAVKIVKKIFSWF